MSNIQLTLGSLALVSVLSSSGAGAAGPSKEWSDSWEFSGPSSRSVQLYQADLIERERADYYKGLSTNTFVINNTSNTAIGTYVDGTIDVSITGDDNNVNALNGGTNSGAVKSKSEVNY